MLPGTYGDVTIAVDVELVDPSPSQFVQLACRSQNAASQYRFGFRPATGEVWINRWLPKPSPGEWRGLTEPGLTSPAVHLGRAVNRAELSCHGTTIEGSINGVTAASVTDNSFFEGQLWIAVGETFSEKRGATPVGRFSNLLVTQK